MLKVSHSRLTVNRLGSLVFFVCTMSYRVAGGIPDLMARRDMVSPLWLDRWVMRLMIDCLKVTISSLCEKSLANSALGAFLPCCLSLS